MDQFKKRFENVFSRKVEAGKKRVYFFNVKKSAEGEYHMVVTENTKKFNEDTVERHSIYVYKEDLNKFLASMQETIDHIKELMPDYDFDKFSRPKPEFPKKESTKIVDSADDISW